jgi:hypothetical protein
MKKRAVFVISFLLLVSFAAAQTDVEPELYAGEDQQRISQKIQDNLDVISMENAPGVLRFLLGKPYANLLVDEYVFGFAVEDGAVAGFYEHGLEDPNYLILMTEDSLDKIIDGADAGEMYQTGEIIVQAETIGAKIKLWFANIWNWLFGEKPEEPGTPKPTEDDSDGDFMTDTYEFKWESDPQVPDEDMDGVLDGWNDLDGDFWFSSSEEKGNSDPTDKNDTPKNKTCTIDCCCTVYIQYWGTCGDYDTNAPSSLGPYNWTPAGSNVVSGGSVEGRNSYLYVNDDSSVYRCYDRIVYKYTYNAAGEQCDNKYEFCKNALGSACKLHEQAAAAGGSQALQQCVDDVKENCNGRFSQHTDHNNVASTC